MRNFHEIGRSLIYSMNGLAATSHPLATLEAILILKQGGNAIDAAIAANAVLSVVEPQSTGIGGDCFALIHIQGNKKPIAINGSGKAASYADVSFFEKRKIDTLDINSVHSITIPGCVGAWSKMSKTWGKLSWGDLFKSAIDYSKKGYVVLERIAYDWDEIKNSLSFNKNTSNTFLKTNGQAYKTGDIFINPKLGKSLELIAKEGKEAFYEGEIAKDIVFSLEKIGGLHSLKDFQQQDTLVLEPIQVEYRDKILYQCPPNNQGITALIIMKILEELKINQYAPMSFERFHLEAEATKLGYYLRDQIVGDNPENKLNYYNKFLDQNYIEKLQKLISFEKALDFFDKNLQRVFSPDTVYLTVIDKDKNVVSIINSIFHPFGSGITTDNTGIVLHNRGACFSLKRNHPNCIAPGKRPLHTICQVWYTKMGNFS